MGVRSAKAGRHGDGKGLYLLVGPTGAKSWLLRVQVNGIRRDIGLGSVSDLGLAGARERAAALRTAARAGLDPIAERDKDQRRVPTFAEAAASCHTDLLSGWGAKTASGFLSSLKTHAFPAIGSMRIDLVDASHLRDMLAPIWTDKPEMARKVRQRAGIVLNYAKSKGWRETEAPGKSVTMGLARQGPGRNYASMPYAEVPAFVARVSAMPETVGRMALLFAIYTAARSGETRKARWSHIDLERKLWNRPAHLMKGKVSHTVTLTEPAIVLLKRAAGLRKGEADDVVFPSRKGTPLSDMTLSKIMRDMKVPSTVHGFRSSFRDFAAEQMSTIPDPVAEAALAHVVPDKVERAYKRTSFLEMRRTLLDGWGAYLAQSSPTAQTPDMLTE